MIYFIASDILYSYVHILCTQNFVICLVYYPIILFHFCHEQFFLCQEYILKGKVSSLYEYSKIFGVLLILDIQILLFPVE